MIEFMGIVGLLLLFEFSPVRKTQQESGHMCQQETGQIWSRWLIPLVSKEIIHQKI